jgi:hypothetical protein
MSSYFMSSFLFSLMRFFQTPLHIAARNGRDDCVVFLIAFGAELEVNESFPVTFLFESLCNSLFSAERRSTETCENSGIFLLPFFISNFDSLVFP